ncbi:MAG TPA: hypothetical protein VMR86_03960 [Myxococcota bacterium]|nr:hypothetical protein [Myxococcota bacterium]
MADSGERVLRHLLRAGEELAALAGAVLELLAERAPARADWHAALLSESQRWAARAHGDPAAARVAELFAALAEVFAEPAPGAARAEPQPGRAGRRDTRRKFDPPPGRWDTPARWRS